MSDGKYYSYIERKMINSYYDDNNNNNKNKIIRNIFIAFIIIIIAYVIVFKPFVSDDDKFIKDYISNVKECHETFNYLITNLNDNNFSDSYKQELLTIKETVNNLNFNDYSSEYYSVVNNFNNYKLCIINSIDLIINNYVNNSDFSIEFNNYVNEFSSIRSSMDLEFKTILESKNYYVSFDDNKLYIKKLDN